MNVNLAEGKVSPTPETKREDSVSRRDFLKLSSGLGAGLILEFSLLGAACSKKPESDASFEPNAFIHIGSDGVVTIVVHKVEMGQGTYTAMPMLIAEELEIDVSKVKLKHAPPSDKLYGDPLLGAQITGGSTSVRGAWKPLREAGAAARIMLINAAADEWKVPAESLHAENGEVISSDGKHIAYGELVEKASKMPVPEAIALKDPKDFKIIGKSVRRLDTPAKVNGQAEFGIDTRIPGMKIVAVAASPVFGGKVAQVDDSKAKAIKGYQGIIKLENAVAVIGDHMWAAKQGLAALDIQWDEGKNAQFTSDSLRQDIAKASEQKGAIAKNTGNAVDMLEHSGNKVESVYELPFLAHATMEPINCTVHVQKDSCDIWVGTQVPVIAQATAAKLTGLPPEKVQIHNHLLGGGFGRRLEVDFIEQAVLIAKQVDFPVKVVWSREEDVQHDMYRPYYYDRIAASLDADGKPEAWTHRITGSSIMARFFPAAVKDGVDPDAVEGATDIQYAIPNVHVEYVRHEPPFLTAFWRGVGPTRNFFVVESFVDELAVKAKQDPFEYRRALLDHSPRAKAVLELAAEKAGWHTPLPKPDSGKAGRGIALLFAFGSYVAQVADVQVSDDNQVSIKRVVCAVDCGHMVNPDTVKAQMEGGIIFGISAALWGEITFDKGRAQQSNFHDYRVLRMQETPIIEVHLVQSTEAPGGIGEPGTSILAPAVANAVFAATGKRIRKLPIESALQNT